MSLTPAQVEKAYFDAIKEYTNNFRDIRELKDAPYIIRLAVEKIITLGSRDGSVKSESISDLSLTFHDIQGLPNDIRILIDPFCKVRF